MDTDANVRRYWAFLSYSHADKAWADWLHKALERYPMPRDLVGKPTPADAPVPKRFVPVFRDREELPTATDLAAVIDRALKHARFLVVICSPRSAKSPWVEQEIVQFKRLHGESRVLCLIVGGEPWASDGKPGSQLEDECFPRAVRYRLGADGELSHERTEPIAADAREGKDGRENAVIKLMAGLLGVGFDDLRRREQEYQRRRVRRLQALTAVFALLFVAAVSAATYAVIQKRAVQRTLSRADLQLAIQARDQDDGARAAAFLARSLRSDPSHRAAAVAAHSMVAHHKIHPPVGPALRHPAAVTAALGSPDGKWIVTAAADRVYLWSRPDNRLVAERSLDGSAVTSLVATPPRYVAATRSGNIHFFAWHKLEPAGAPIKTGAGPVHQLAWNPMFEEFAVGLSDSAEASAGNWLVRFSAEGRELARQSLTALVPRHLAWSADGTQVAVAGNSPNFYVMRRDGSALQALKSKLTVSGLRFNAEGALQTIDILAGLQTWDLGTSQPQGKAKAVRPSSSAVAFAADGRHFLGSRNSQYAYLYEMDSAKILTEPISPGFTVAISAYLDAEHVLLGSDTGLAQVRRLRDGAPAAALMTLRNGYTDLSTLHPDGVTAAAGYTDARHVQFFDTSRATRVERTVRFPVKLRAIGFVDGGQTLAAIGWDGRLHRVAWRKALQVQSTTEALIPEIKDSFGAKRNIRFAPRGNLIAIPSQQQVLLVDGLSGQIRQRLELGSAVTALAWFADGSLLAVACADQSVRFFRTDGSPAAGRPTIRPGYPAIELAVDPAGQRLAILSNADQVGFFDTMAGSPVGTGFGAGPHTTGLNWVCAGQYVVAGDMDGVVKLWDPDSGLPVAVLPSLGSSWHGALALPGEDSLLLTANDFIAPVRLAPRENPPDWWPGFLEAMAASTLDSRRPDPDQWLRSTARPGSGDATTAWGDLRKWVLEGGSERPAALPAPVSEADNAAAIAALKIANEVANEIARLQTQMSKLWSSNDSQQMAQVGPLLEKAIALDPSLTGLFRTKAQIGDFMENPALMRDAFLGLAAADSSLIEVLDAKTDAARACLRLSPPQTEQARSLLQEVRAIDPNHAGAAELLGKLTN